MSASSSLDALIEGRSDHSWFVRVWVATRGLRNVIGVETL